MSMKLNKYRDKAGLHKAVPRKYKEVIQLVPEEKAPYFLAVLNDGVVNVRRIKKTNIASGRGVYSGSRGR